jgi:hypothetical protein
MNEALRIKVFSNLILELDKIEYEKIFNNLYK